MTTFLSEHQSVEPAAPACTCGAEDVARKGQPLPRHLATCNINKSAQQYVREHMATKTELERVKQQVANVTAAFNASSERCVKLSQRSDALQKQIADADAALLRDNGYLDQIAKLQAANDALLAELKDLLERHKLAEPNEDQNWQSFHGCTSSTIAIAARAWSASQHDQIAAEAATGFLGYPREVDPDTWDALFDIIKTAIEKAFKEWLTHTPILMTESEARKAYHRRRHDYKP